MTSAASRRRQALALVLAVLAVAAVLGLRTGDAAAKPKDKPHKKVCTDAPAGAAECHAEVVTKADGVTPDASTTPATDAYGPADLQSAYALPGGTAGSGKTIAIVDAFDNPNAESDLAAYRTQYGLAPCTTANGCFRKVNQQGNTSPLPRGDVSWGQEIDLDLQAASAACPGCKLLLVEASSDYFSDIAAAVDTAATFGPAAISNSYGAREFFGETNYESHYNHPGIAVTASSGDSGYGGAHSEFPVSSRYVTAVGGTQLTRNASARGWNETAWSGGGSGCSKYVSKPSWQKDAKCANRTVADVAAVADPNTGLNVYDSYGSSGGGNWYVFGGTSLSTPIVAVVFALGGASDTSYVYGHASSLNDVTSGANGGCASYLCRAQAGYDGPTGLGTPNGTGAFGGGNPGSSTTTTTTSTSTTTTSTTTTSTTTTSTTTTTSSTTSTTTSTTTTTTTAPTTTTTTTPTTTSSTTTTTTAVGTPPSAPQSLRVTSTVGGITLSWQPPASSGSSPVTGYKIYRGAWGAETYLATTPGTTFTDTSAPMWTYYFYRVAAVNAAGQGPYSSDVGAQRTG